MKRLPGWRARLSAYIETIRRTPLAYGTHDCGVGLAAGVVEALTGEDIAAEWRGTYSSREEAFERLSKAGYADLPGLVSSLLPAHEHPSRAQVGDIVGVPSGDAFGAVLGLCNGATLLLLGERGIVVADLSRATIAWRVG